MKVLFSLMLAANLIFFAAMQWGTVLFSPPALEQAEPELNPQKIALLSEMPAALPVVTAPSRVIAASSVIPSVVSTACMEWGEFSADNLPAAQKELAAQRIPFNQRLIEHSSEYWVYIPPLKNTLKRDQKVAELKAAGISSYAVVQDAGEWEHAISLGTFNSPTLAQQFADSLPKNIAFKIGEYRPAYQTTVLLLNDLDAAALAKLTELQKQFAKSSLNNIACGKTSL